MASNNKEYKFEVISINMMYDKEVERLLPDL